MSTITAAMSTTTRTTGSPAGGPAGPAGVPAAPYHPSGLDMSPSAPAAEPQPAPTTIGASSLTSTGVSTSSTTTGHPHAESMISEDTGNHLHAPEHYRNLLQYYHMEQAGLFDFLGVEVYGGEKDTQKLLGEHEDDVEAARRSFLDFQERMAEIKFEEGGDDSANMAAGNKSLQGGGGGGGNQNLQGDAATLVTFVKGFVGIGVLSMPYAMSQGGYIGGPVGLLVLSFMAYQCMLKLLDATRIINLRVLHAQERARIEGWDEDFDESFLGAASNVWDDDEDFYREHSSSAAKRRGTSSARTLAPVVVGATGLGKNDSLGGLQMTPAAGSPLTPSAAPAAPREASPLGAAETSSSSPQQTVQTPAQDPRHSGSAVRKKSLPQRTLSRRELRDWRTEEVKTFGDVGKFVMGKAGKSLINISIILMQAGFCIAYLVFIPENIQKVLCYETRQVRNDRVMRIFIYID